MIQKGIELIIRLLSMFTIGVMFLFVVALMLSASILALACARGVYDFYISDLAKKVKKKYENLSVQENRNQKTNAVCICVRPMHQREMSMVYRRKMPQAEHRKETYENH